MTNYQNGAQFERECKAELEERGFHCVRSAGSHSPADIIALRKGSVPVAVQCKRDGRLDPDEWNEFVDWCEESGCNPVLAKKVRGGIKWHSIFGKKKPGGGKQPMTDWSIF